MIGVPMVPLVARTGEGRDNLLDTIISVFERRDPVVRHVHVNLGADVENAVRRLVDVLKAEPAVDKDFRHAIWLYACLKEIVRLRIVCRRI